MAQGEFTKQEAEATIKAVEEIFKALPKSKRLDYLGHYNNIALFVDAAKKHAPDEKQAH